MKRIKYIYCAVLCSLLVFASCDKDAVEIPDTGDKVPITLSASSLPVSVDLESRVSSNSGGMRTRAETISGRSIGVIGVEATGNTLNDVTSWTSYYLNHIRADGTNNDVNSEKEVAFETTQWWPFNPAEYVAFVAYSPHNSGDSRVVRASDTNNILKVTANTTNSFPDFVYTTPVGPWNKEDAKAAYNKTLSLGEFQHAMAKLDIEVILVDKEGNPLVEDLYPDPNRLRITELKVSTERMGGSFDLLASPNTWSLDGATTETVVRTHISSSTTLIHNLPTYTDCYLLPGTEGESYVSITLQELDATTNTAIHTINRKAKVSEFEVSAGVGAELEMGKTTLLTIKVKYVPIPDPEEDIILEGQLIEWDYKGKSTVTIE